MSSKLYNLASKLLYLISLPLVALILFCHLLISPALAKEAISAPPSGRVIIVASPEVWGYDLRDHELIPPGYELFGLTYYAPNGDIVYKISRCVAHCDQPNQARYEYAMLWFLAGKIEFLAEDLITPVYIERHQLKSVSRNRVELPNGECIKTIHLRTGTSCQVNDLAENLLIKGQCSILDDAYKIFDHDIVANRNPAIKRYSIIGAQDSIYRYMDQPDGSCDRGGPGGGELIYEQLYPMKSIIGLKDGTFIASRGDLLIRFDSNFKTKFIPKHDVELAYKKVIKGNFFVLPYEKIQEFDDIVATHKDHGVQGLHDELLLYLYRREENK